MNFDKLRILSAYFVNIINRKKLCKKIEKFSTKIVELDKILYKSSHFFKELSNFSYMKSIPKYQANILQYLAYFRH